MQHTNNTFVKTRQSAQHSFSDWEEKQKSDKRNKHNRRKGRDNKRNWES